ncbi:nucleotidyltransferase domain protein [bacterium BMS3Bbin11]|nr:nucleotidyltransferase domain protein [bacterium BMS3Bbin11]HDH08321.1 nucleotidyltransferase [Gammaproteobacteria bacterium]HDH16624.1 nucleotidyltransferase [Gammaproteobacteria bacterium]
MFLDQLHEKKKRIVALSGKYGARRIRVFGSIARGEERPDSDVDFLVDFPAGYDLFSQRMPLMNDLQALLGRPVEVIPEHELSPYIREQVLNEAVDL